MIKKVLMYTKPKIGECAEVKEYLEGQEVSLLIRDIEDRPLGRHEITNLLRHFDLKHFLDTDSKVYKRNKIETSMPPRDEIINMIVENNDLLRVPIFVYGRLMTVGCNREKLAEMLQVRNNGSGNESEVKPRQPRVNRRTKK